MFSNMAKDAEFKDPVDSPVRKSHGEVGKYFDGLSKVLEIANVCRDKVYLCRDQIGLVCTISGHMTNGQDVTFDDIDIIKFDGV